MHGTELDGMGIGKPSILDQIRHSTCWLTPSVGDLAESITAGTTKATNGSLQGFNGSPTLKHSSMGFQPVPSHIATFCIA